MKMYNRPTTIRRTLRSNALGNKTPTNWRSFERFEHLCPYISGCIHHQLHGFRLLDVFAELFKELGLSGASKDHTQLPRAQRQVRQHRQITRHHDATDELWDLFVATGFVAENHGALGRQSPAASYNVLTVYNTKDTKYV